jgi:demethylmenaquinone methyltransferase/2-methoxy-6-polyprenyl-1,4-benzoquinol methylase
MANKLYADSRIELSPLIARHYDRIMNTISFGKYESFIRQAVKDMNIRPGEAILDMGCGSGKNAALMAEYLGKDGRLTGLDVSSVMQKQFLAKHAGDERISFLRQRVDIPFGLGEKFDKVVISFVIHGFPHKVREQMIMNAQKHLKPGGKLIILDWSEFSLDEMPGHHRFIFKTVECDYAFDFINRDWKSILGDFGFGDFTENHYFRNYARLLTGLKKKVPAEEIN